MPVLSTGVGDVFVGRAAECRLLADYADRAVHGQSWAVLVEGGPGAGKTALLRHGAPDPEAFVVLGAACDPVEARVPFGLVSQLLWRARCRIGPAAAAVGQLSARKPPARVGAQLLDIVHAAQVRAPLALVIDDLQWADPASAEALCYLLRRLEGARVLTVMSARTRMSAAGDWETGSAGYWRRLIDDRQFGRRISLDSLTTEEVAELAAGLGHGTIPLTTAERLRRHTDGIPASVRALLAGRAHDWLTRSDAPLPVPDPVAAQVGALLTTLAPASRSLLDALAVLDGKYPLALAARVGGVADPVTALEPLLTSEVVRWWPEDPATVVRVRLPVHRDAVYRLLTPGRRRELHLAAAVVAHGDAKWAHRMAAVGGADGALARELELAAERARREGAGERAGTMLLWSADLSDDRAGYERRLLAAAAELIWSHSPGRTEALRPRVAECAPGPLRELVLAALPPQPASGTPKPALVQALAQPLTQLLAGVPPAPADLLQAAARVALTAARDQPGAGAIARQVLASDGLDSQTRVMAECLVAETAGQRQNGDVVLRALESVSTVTAGQSEAILLWRRGTWRARAGQLTGAADDLAVALRLNRGHGELAIRATTLLACLQYLLGHWEEAAATADQAIVLALGRGSTSSYARAHAVAACVAAGRGALGRAEDLARSACRWWRTAGPASDARYPAVAAAVVAQAKGDYPAMLSALQPLPVLSSPASAQDCDEWCWWWPLRAEALIGAGRLDEAEQALSGLTAAAAGLPCLRAGNAWLAGWLAARRGELDTARKLYEEEINAASPADAGDDIPLLRARLEHAYGNLLLAQRSRRAAVSALRSAQERYRNLGAAPFLVRCDADLAACGLRAPGSRNVLSTQEDRVARLVAQGMTNQEVAQRLYVSTKTVEFHLSNVFTKLGIASRRQLVRGYPVQG